MIKLLINDYDFRCGIGTYIANTDSIKIFGTMYKFYYTNPGIAGIGSRSIC